ncbi:MAG: hypothetical protein KDC67_04195 [Ignavibacteriae bacterium]|nr:hypothetical protein [Ignavibacteriota bacterium]
MSKKFRVNQKVYIQRLHKYGVVKEVTKDGRVSQVEIDGEIINVLNLVIEAISILERLWLSIKGVFKNRKKDE